jgi:signal transduction histidine kinase/CheY-like chemotaxis protein
VRRLRPVDRALLLTLGPLWAVFFVASLLSARQDLPFSPFYVSAGAGADAYPTIASWGPTVPEQPALRLGDRLLRVAGADLRGVGPVGFTARVWAAIGPDGRATAEIERGGERRTATIVVRNHLPKWPLLPLSLAWAGTAIVALVRAPATRAVQLAFPAMMCIGIYSATYVTGATVTLAAASAVRLLALGLGLPLSIRMASRFVERARPPAWARGWPWALVGVGGLVFAAEYGYPIPPAVAWPALVAGLAAFWVTLFAVVASGYRGADAVGRRRWKWVVLSAFTSGVPQVVAAVATALDAGAFRFLVVSQLAFVTTPVALVISIFRYNLLDVDRLLSATATYLVLLLLFVGGVLALVPRAARAVAELLEVDPGTAELVVFVLLAVLVLALGQRLRPLMDRWLRAEQRALEEGIGRLLRDLATCGGLRDITALVGDRLAQLLRPAVCVVYAHAGGGWVAAAARGMTPTPDLPRRSPLIGSLEASPTPVTAEAWRGARKAFDVDAGDRAVLEALGAAVLVPVRREGRLEAFVALGPKLSGDVYTSTDLTLLGAVSERTAAELSRLADAELIRQQQGLVEALQAEKDAAVLANEAKSRFLAAASHDLRQPLHALGLFVGALEDQGLSPEGRRLVQNIRASTQAMEEMFNSVLDVSRLDAGVIEVNVTEVPLGPLLGRLEAELRPLAEARRLALRVEATSLVGRSDAVLLRRIIQNLLTNALRFTDEGEVAIDCRARGAEVAVTVRDTGRGIAPEHQRLIFEEYRRLEGGAGRDGGLGLGLAIVQRLVRLLGHRLLLDSTPGRGSAFTVTLPQGVASMEATATPRAPGDMLAGACLLVIDDDPSILDGMRDLVGGWGCHVLTAASAEEARRVLAAAERMPDAMLVDYRLTDGMTGVQVVDAVRAAVGREISALLVTGDSAPERLREAQATGLLLLTKPVAPVRLRAALEHLLRR